MSLLFRSKRRLHLRAANPASEGRYRMRLRQPAAYCTVPARVAPLRHEERVTATCPITNYDHHLQLPSNAPFYGITLTNSVSLYDFQVQLQMY